jgi:hypothetical protein
MKSISSRFDTKDSDDIKFIIQHLKIKTKKEILDIIQRHYPKRLIPVKTELFIEELFEPNSK